MFSQFTIDCNSVQNTQNKHLALFYLHHLWVYLMHLHTLSSPLHTPHLPFQLSPNWVYIQHFHNYNYVNATAGWAVNTHKLISILFHRSVWLSWSMIHTVFTMVTLYFVLKLGRVRPPTLLFFLKIVVTILSPLHFHVDFGVNVSISARKATGIWYIYAIYRSIWGVLPWQY